MMFTPRRALLAAALLTVGVATAMYYADLLCAAFESNPTSGSPQSAARGRELFLQACQACHGPEGRGDGPATAALAKRPKDLTRIAAPPVFPDGVLGYRIRNGGEVMPAWKGVLSDAQVWDLVSYIRSQGRKDSV